MAQSLGKGVSLLHGLVDLGAVVEIVSECSIDIRESQSLFGGDLVRALAQTFVPDDDISHGDPMSRNARLPTRDAGRHLDMSV